MKNLDCCENCACDPGESWVSARSYDGIKQQLSEAKQRIAELENPERIKEIAIKFGEHIEEKFLASKGLFLSTKEYYEWIETPEGKKLLNL